MNDLTVSGKLAIVRGGGDLATGIIYRLWRSKYRVLCLEAECPMVVRRTVSVAQAIFDGRHTVDGMSARSIKSIEEWSDSSDVAVLVDPEAQIVSRMKPDLLVDAIMAKKNLGTHRGMAPLVIAIGPGFSAPEDVHAVVETKRGHDLGRLIITGSAIPNTGIPGMEMGYTVERLLRAPCDGVFTPICQIGDHVEAGQIVGAVGKKNVLAQISGVVRGLIHPSVSVSMGLKIGDVDPRNERSHCFSITDKALAIGGGVLEAILSMAP